MEITIKKEYPYEFVLYLISFFEKFTVGKLDINKIKKIENYYNNIINLNSNDRLDIVGLVLNCSKYMSIKEFDSKYIIGFDDSTIPYTDIKIIDIFKFINYGTILSKAYPIFTKSFSYIKKNIKYIYNMYISTGGVL